MGAAFMHLARRRLKRRPRQADTARSSSGADMKEPTILRCARGRAFAAACLVAVTATPRVASADESGVSFWLPGFFGSLAVAPHVARAREFQIGKIPVNLTANVSANVDARADLALAMPNYTFATPVFGGQLTVGAIG